MLRNWNLHRRSLAMELSSSSPSSFESMAPLSSSSSYMWRAMIPSSSFLPSSSYSQFAQLEEEHFTWKQTLGVLGHPPSPSTFACLLRSCIENTALAHGRLTHELIIISGFNHIPLLQSLLLQMYDHFAAVEDVLNIFLSIHQKDVALWNISIEALRAKEARFLYRRMQEEGAIPNRTTCMILLSVLGDQESLLLEGKRIHVLTIEIGCKADVYVGTALVNMYGKCGGLVESRATFNAMPSRNVISWTTMISVYAQHFEGDDAFQLFEKMLQENVNPDRVTFVNVITGCASQFMLEEGQLLHTWIFYYGLEKHVSIVNALINLYGKCGALGEAQLVFHSTHERDIISFSSLISAYAGHEKFSEALSLFHEMELAGFSPNKIALLNVLSTFACQEALRAGQDIHKCIVERGFDGDVLICNALINMYHKCGCAESARIIFHKMPDRNVISWTSIIGMHAQEGRYPEAFQAFEGLQREGLMPNRVTFVSMVELCGSHVVQAEGRCVHACIVGDSGFELGLVLGTSLVKMYGFHGSLEDAEDVFDRTVERDVLTWNSIITVYVDHGYNKKALQLFAIMMGKGTLPDNATYGLLLVACSMMGALCLGKEMHARAQGSEVVMNVVTATNIVNMYGKCRNLSQSYRLFDKMLVKNIISWTTMISSYMENGLDEMALQWFEQMLQECVLPNMVTFINIVTICTNQLAIAGGKRIHVYIFHSDFRFDIELGNALVSMYGKCEALKDAQQTFDSMLVKNVVSWSGMIAAYAQHSDGMAALQLFEEMQLIGVLPNDVTLVSLLDACISQTCLAAGECLHTFLLNNRFELSVLVGNSMVNMYNKCGNIHDAWKTFATMKEKDTTTWSVMIGACAEHGQGKEAVQLIEQMMQKGLTPDEAAIVNFLSACSHCGLIDVGWHAFSSIIQDFCLTQDHCACIIDLFCRAGVLETAYVLIDCVPVHPTLTSFMALLGSCRYQGDINRGECMAGHVQELDAKQTALLYMLNHIYHTACSVDDKARAGTSMLQDAGG